MVPSSSLLEALDVSALRALYAAGPLSLYGAQILSLLGSGWLMLGLLPLYFMKERRAWALLVTATLTLTSGAVSLLKLLVGRMRPCHALAWAHVLPIDVPSDCSFPSGHAAGSFAMASLVFASRRREGGWLLVLAALIGLSRVMLGVHYLSDVLAGAILGALFGWAAPRVHQAIATYRGASHFER
jgi:undecaprenyl-diphosphatase